MLDFYRFDAKRCSYLTKVFSFLVFSALGQRSSAVLRYRRSDCVIPSAQTFLCVSHIYKVYSQQKCVAIGDNLSEQ